MTKANSCTERNNREQWWNRNRTGWPKRVVDKPYTSDFTDSRALVFMPRFKKPMRACRLALKRIWNGY